MLASEMTEYIHQVFFKNQIVFRSCCSLMGQEKSNIESEHQNLFLEIFRPFTNWPQPAFTASYPPATSLPTPQNPNSSPGTEDHFLNTPSSVPLFSVLPLWLMPPSLFSSYTSFKIWQKRHHHLVVHVTPCQK